MTNDTTYPDVQRRLEERRELTRIAAQRVLDDQAAGRVIHPDTVSWAKHWASVKPLGRPLGSGEPEKHQ